MPSSVLSTAGARTWQEGHGSPGRPLRSPALRCPRWCAPRCPRCVDDPGGQAGCRQAAVRPLPATRTDDGDRPPVAGPRRCSRLTAWSRESALRESLSPGTGGSGRGGGSRRTAGAACGGVFLPARDAVRMDMIQHLAAYAADPALGDRCLVERAVSIKDEIARGLVVGEGLSELLDHPCRRWVAGDPEVHHAPTTMVDEEEDVQDIEGRGRHGEEVHPDDGLLVVAEEDLPPLDHVPWRWPSRHVPRHRPLRDVEAELQQLAMDPRGTPGRVFASHPADEVAQLAVDARPARAPRARPPSPEQAEALAMPANHGVGLHDNEDICPPRPEPAKRDPEESVRDRQPGPRPPLREDGDLLTEGEVLEGDVDATTEKRAEAVREEDDVLNHETRMADPGHIHKVGRTAGALRGRGHSSSDPEPCRPWIDF